MASWSDRAGSRRLQEPALHQHQQLGPRHSRAGSTGGGRFGTASRVPDFSAFDSLQQMQADSSSSDEDLHPSRRPRHTRSISHPFPSLFSSTKKTSGSMKPSDGSGTDSGGEPTSRGKRLPPAPGHRNGSSVGSRDFATGHCMTCRALVRWPKELQVFRCTICLTINDLQPADRDGRRDEAQELTGPPKERAEPSEKPISLGYTKLLIEQCLGSFLTSALKADAAAFAVDDQEPHAASSHPAPEDNKNCNLSPTSFLAPQPKGSATGGFSSAGPHRRAPSWSNTTLRSYSTSYPERRPVLPGVIIQGCNGQQTEPPSGPEAEGKRIFRALEDYIVRCFTSFHCLNSSFATPRSHHHAKHGPDDIRRRSPLRHPEPRREPHSSSHSIHSIPDLDPKLLLVGDFAENGMWWTGSQEEVIPGRTASNRSHRGHSIVSARNPRIDWSELEEWYMTVIDSARPWLNLYESLTAGNPVLAASPGSLRDIEARVLAGQEHVQRTLLKACETILKRPGRRITEPDELRFLLIITANPLLHSSYKPYTGKFTHAASAAPPQTSPPHQGTGPSSGRHSGIIKRIAGLMSNTPAECQNHLVSWFARYTEAALIQTKDLMAEFLAYRLNRQNEKKHEKAQIDIMGSLIPSMGAGQSVASLHAALGHGPGGSRSKKQKEKPKKIIFQDDWQIKAAAEVLGFLFSANNMGLHHPHARRGLASRPDSPANSSSSRERVKARGQVLATSDFYTTLLDESDLVADFEAWERKQGRFSFCQYPFLLSIGAKIQILEHDARRQMETKARDAFFDSIMTNRVVQQFLVLTIRRECLVEDSLQAVSEVIGGGGEDIKKGLKINFKGEEGVDAGGLRKEWFLLLVREVFNPDHGMFLYDEDSQYCYFNPNSLEPSEQFFLVGVVFGLAIYNSTILDVALPPFAFRKLLCAAPPSSSLPTSQPRQTMTYTLDDLAEYRPRLAHGLRQLLEFEGDVESTFGLDFAIDVERYGATERVALCQGGERRAVTNGNRREYVDAYVRYLLDVAVARQFEPFKRGFFTVCGGNALGLFRPEEIELLVRGSDEKLDVQALKAVAEYDGWFISAAATPAAATTTAATTATATTFSNAPAGGSGGKGGRVVMKNPAEEEPTVKWFWEAFEGAEVKDQRRLLAFITGSDRIPAMGAASLVVRVVCAGEDCGRFPTARTCFNTLMLYRCETRERLEGVLWRAVGESEGFGLK
ncbi:Putative E3 ubiquitin-protein ligase [Madurella fahalii]|uniref:HECT-type E3 ubiquitin transferase n=1 Tax=Madurella fahalii TaxID=1157608 RepID=A0ABQ0G6E8_9PEZI